MPETIIPRRHLRWFGHV